MEIASQLFLAEITTAEQGELSINEIYGCGRGTLREIDVLDVQYSLVRLTTGLSRQALPFSG